MELKDKVILITGASSGIGQAVAFRFAKEGAKVVIHYNQNKKGALATLKGVSSDRGGSVIVQANLTNESEIKRMFEETVEQFGTVDILINNAASPSELVPYWKATSKDILELFNINIVNAMTCSKYAVEIMMKRKVGKIINTSSIKGWEHGGGSVSYAVSKAAINSFTRTLAKQLAPDIQVNAVAPGYVKTRVYDDQPKEKIKNWLEGTYLKRWITKDEVADAFVFLARNDAMTGQIIYVDGGYTLK